MHYYVKSFEEDFILKTLVGKKKVNFQSIFDIVDSKFIKPNTKSFGRSHRLSCTILDRNYTKTYRPQGLIFQTDEKPDYIIPFDLVLASKAGKIIVHYYRIKNDLHLYYNHDLIPGYEKFIFKDFLKLKKKFPNINSVWKAINIFRERKGYDRLPIKKHRLVEYNEAVFHHKIKIYPVAIYGYRKETSKIAKILDLPRFKSAKDFFEKVRK